MRATNTRRRRDSNRPVMVSCVPLFQLPSVASVATVSHATLLMLLLALCSIRVFLQNGGSDHAAREGGGATTLQRGASPTFTPHSHHELPSPWYHKSRCFLLNLRCCQKMTCKSMITHHHGKRKSRKRRIETRQTRPSCHKSSRESNRHHRNDVLLFYFLTGSRNRKKRRERDKQLP